MKGVPSGDSTRKNTAPGGSEPGLERSPRRTWRQRMPAIPWNFFAVLALVPLIAVLHEAWTAWRWNVRLNALRRLQSAAAGQRSGLSPVGITESPRSWRRLVEPTLALPPAGSRADDRLGFLWTDVRCNGIYLYDVDNDSQLRDVRKFPELKELRLSGGTVTKEGLISLGALRDLVSLTLQDLSLDASDLQPLGRLGHLEKLSLNKCRLRTAALSSLPPLAALEQLSLDAATLSGGGLSVLDRLPRLAVLSLRGTAVDDGDLSALPRLDTLRSLDLSETRVSGVGLKSLCQTPGLKNLSLDHAPLPDAGLANLPELRSLTQLSLRGTNLGGAGLSALARLPALQVLFLDETSLDDSGLKHLPHLPQLRTLSLRKTSISSAAMPLLKARLPGLTVLELPRTPTLTREVLDELMSETGWRVFH
jgi:hypothetical protein